MHIAEIYKAAKKIINHSDRLSQLIQNEHFFKYSVSKLHEWIRFFE